MMMMVVVRMMLMIVGMMVMITDGADGNGCC